MRSAPGLAAAAALMLASPATGQVAERVEAPAAERAAVDPALAGLEQAWAASGDPALAALLAERLAVAGDGPAVERLLDAIVASGRPFLPPGHSAIRTLPQTDGLRRRLDALEARLPRSARGRRVLTLPAGPVVEGVAWDRRTRTLYFGDMLQRTVSRRAADGTVERVLHLPLTPLGMAVDPSRGRLWIAASAAPFGEGAPASQLVGLDLATGAMEVFIPAGPAGFNDVAVAPDGTVYVSDMAGGGILRLRPQATTLEPLVPGGTFASPNGLAVDETGAWLFVAQGRALMRVEVATGTAVRLTDPQTLVTLGTDGLYYRDGSLYAISGLLDPGRVLRLDLSDDRAAVVATEVLDSAHPDFDLPTTGVLTDDALWVVANAQIHRADPARAPRPGSPSPVRLLAYPLGSPTAER